MTITNGMLNVTPKSAGSERVFNTIKITLVGKMLLHSSKFMFEHLFVVPHAKNQ